jgi:major membrane immunogen (membrane-anchored lipoprotein)
MRAMTIVGYVCLSVVCLAGCGGKTATGKIKDGAQARVIFEERLASVKNFNEAIKDKNSTRLAEAIPRMNKNHADFFNLDLNSGNMMLVYTEYKDRFAALTKEKDQLIAEAKASGLLTPEMLKELVDIKKD